MCLCMCVPVCVPVCVHVCVHVCQHVCIHARVRECMHACVQTLVTGRRYAMDDKNKTVLHVCVALFITSNTAASVSFFSLFPPICT